MREALTSLTLRGRTFIAGGATALACGVVLGQTAVVRMGLLVLFLPLLAALAVSRSRYRLTLERTVHPCLVSVGQAARVTLELANEGRTPTGTLLLEEQVPYALGVRPRFVVDGVRHGWRRRVSYPVRSDLRGHHVVGPMTLRATDPFGLVEIPRTFRSTAALTVVPTVVPLGTAGAEGIRSGAGDARARSFATGSAEDVTVRDYRRGDDLRRVHWRSSARADELMVRREEQPWQSRATVVLDNRAISHRGRGAASSLEPAVTAAASIASHLVELGHDVRLVTANGTVTDAGRHRRSRVATVRPLLEELARVQADPRPAMAAEWLAATGTEELVVAVLGAHHPHDRPFLDRLRRHGGSLAALVLDVDAWGPSPSGPAPVDEAVRRLAHQGWRATGLGLGDRLDVAWRTVAP